MSNQVISVTSCEGCPLLDSIMNVTTLFICCHPQDREVIKSSLAELFESCPLKEHSLTIQIGKDENKQPA